MSLKLLSDVVEELGYPRNNFLNINRAGNDREIEISERNRELPDDYYLITMTHKDNTTGYTLIRKKKEKHDNSFTRISNMNTVHLYSSIIKNILLGNYEKELTYNILLYILYYRVVYKSYNPLTNIEITDGVIIELSNIIKLMIDKENTTYKDEPRISDIIAELRKLLIRERIHKGIKPKLNLRR